MIRFVWTEHGRRIVDVPTADKDVADAMAAAWADASGYTDASVSRPRPGPQPYEGREIGEVPSPEMCAALLAAWARTGTAQTGTLIMKRLDELVADPAITEATVMRRAVAKVGDRVKHWGQRYTGCATATVTGFVDVGRASPHWDGDTLIDSWIKVMVAHDVQGGGVYGDPAWDWDRTELAPDN